jgi:hypothetical protein
MMFNSIDPAGHLISMGVFGVVGYWAHVWDLRAQEIIAEKRAQIAERKKARIQALEELQAKALQETESS